MFTILLSSLLNEAFGHNAPSIIGVWLDYYGEPTSQEWNGEYWDIAIPAASQWQIGMTIPAATGTSFSQTFVASVDFPNVAVQFGNCIMSNLYVTDRIDCGVEYNLFSVSMAMPNMAPAGQAPIAAQLVATAISVLLQFPSISNSNDRHCIDGIVAAATDAPLPAASGCLEPDDRRERGRFDPLRRLWHGGARCDVRAARCTNWQVNSADGLIYSNPAALHESDFLFV